MRVRARANKREYGLLLYDERKNTSMQKFHTPKFNVPPRPPPSTTTGTHTRTQNDKKKEKRRERICKPGESEKTQFILKYYIKKVFVLVQSLF